MRIYHSINPGIFSKLIYFECERFVWLHPFSSGLKASKSPDVVTFNQVFSICGEPERRGESVYMFEDNNNNEVYFLNLSKV